MPINITQIKNLGDLNEVIVFVNDSASGNFFGIILIALLIIFFLRMMPSGNIKSFVVASFGVFILSLLGLNAGLVAIYYPILFALSFAGSLLYLIFTNG